MSNDTIMNIALSGINVSKKNIEYAIQNISSANIDGYRRRQVTLSTEIFGGKPSGARITGVKTTLDNDLVELSYSKISQDHYTRTLEKYYDKIQHFFGNPVQNDNIGSAIGEFFNSVSDLSTDTSSNARKFDVVRKAELLANGVSNLSKQLQDLRRELDRALYEQVNDVNNLMTTIYGLNQTIVGTLDNSVERLEAEERLHQLIYDMSKLIEVQNYKTDTGQVQLYLSSGETLVSDARYIFRYYPAESEEVFVNDMSFDPAKLYSVDSSDIEHDIDIHVISGGPSAEIKHHLDGGSMKGVIEMRDIIIPRMLQELNILAYKIKQECNRAHNNSISFPPPNFLTGTRSVSHEFEPGFDGSVRIALLDKDGDVLQTGSQYISPVELNLGELDTGSGAGNFNIEGLMQELKYHFGSKLTRYNSVQIGDLYDIKPICLTQELAQSGKAEFGFELENRSENDLDVHITNVKVYDTNLTPITSLFNTSPVTITAGSAAKTSGTNPHIELSLPPTLLTSPITFEVDIDVDDGNAITSSSVLYTLDLDGPNELNGLFNRRLNPDQILSGSGVLTAPLAASPTMTTELQTNERLNVGYGESGLLNLQCANANWCIAIADIDSKHRGTLEVDRTGEDFSTYFGLNDLFVSGDKNFSSWKNERNAAYYMKVRDDILSDHTLFGVAELERSIEDTDNTKPQLYHVAEGDNRGVLRLTGVRNNAVIFEERGGLPRSVVSLNQYANDIIDLNTIRALNLSRLAEQNSLVRDAIEKHLESIAGVDINEELVNVIVFQQTFNASSRLISVSKELYESLLELF